MVNIGVKLKRPKGPLRKCQKGLLRPGITENLEKASFKAVGPEADISTLMSYCDQFYVNF